MNQLVGTVVSEQLSMHPTSISPSDDLPKIKRPIFEGTCPSCNARKTLQQTLNRTAAAVAILADAAASLQFEQLGVGLHKYPPCSFRVCHVCYMKFKCALEVARAELGGIEDIKVAPASRTNTNTVMLAKSFSFDNGRTTLVNTCHLFFFSRCAFFSKYAVAVSSVRPLL
jgi:hypothetical protein